MTLVGALILMLGIEAPPPAALLDVSWDGPALMTGRITLLSVTSTGAPIDKLTGSVNGKSVITFRASPDGKKWLAFAPIYIESAPKPVPVALNALLKDGVTTSWRKPVAVVEAPYESRHITVGKQFVKPSAKQRARAAREAKALSTVLSSSSTLRLWRGSFAKPVAGVETSPFGTKRTYNNKRKSRHLGLDLDGKTGDPIVASNRGRVAMATDRFYSGGTVVLDHGEGLFTMYFHMSRFDVKVGDVVEKGQGLGAVGASGQVTGPHLHFSVKMAGMYVDPRYVLAMDLSSDAADLEELAAAAREAGVGSGDPDPEDEQDDL